jgi:hypothetical protein
MILQRDFSAIKILGLFLMSMCTTTVELHQHLKSQNKIEYVIGKLVLNTPHGAFERKRQFIY